MMKYFVFAIALAAFATAESLDDVAANYDDESSARLLFNTNTSLSTLIPDYRAVLAFVAISIVLMAFVLSSSSSSSAYDKNYYDQSQYDYYNQDQYAQGQYAQDSFNARYGISNLATKMNQLEHAFKKFEVQTEECQMFVACEAAQLRKLKNNVPVVQIVNAILSKPGNEEKLNPNVLRAFKEETNCTQLRNICYAAHNNNQ